MLQNLRRFTKMATSPLLKLPPKLRNIIYEHVVCSEPVIKVNPDGHIIQPRFAATNRQIRSELTSAFTTLLLNRADGIIAKVLNFDFSPLLSVLETSALEAREEMPWMDVEFIFRAPAERGPSQGLREWLKYWKAKPDGEEMGGSYELDESSEKHFLDAMVSMVDSACRCELRKWDRGEAGAHNGMITCYRIECALQTAKDDKETQSRAGDGEGGRGKE